MRSGLVALLAGEGTINTLVGSRVYVNRAPQSAAFPHIIITQINSEENKSLDGTGELRFINFDIDCKDQTSLGVETLGDAVRVFIDDYTGSAGDYTIEAVLLESETSDYEEPLSGDDLGVHVVTLDVQVQYNP